MPYFTAYKALIMGAGAKPGETVLIHGASGAVGTAAVQIARSMGVIVVGTAGTKVGLTWPSTFRQAFFHHNFGRFWGPIGDQKQVDLRNGLSDRKMPS